MYSQLLSFCFDCIRTCFLVGSLTLFYANVWGQSEDLKTIQAVINQALTNAEQFDAKRKLANYYRNSGDIEKYGTVSQELLHLAQKLENDSLLIISYGNLGNYFANKSDFHSTLNYYLKALQLAEKSNDADKIGKLYNNVADQYRSLKNYQQSLTYLRKAQALLPAVASITPALPQYVYINLCETFLGLKASDSALKYIQLANEELLKSQDEQAYINILFDFGLVYDLLEDKDLAESYFQKSIALADSLRDPYSLTDAARHYSLFLFKYKRYDDVKKYALRSMLAAQESGNKLGVINAAALLHKTFATVNQRDSAFHYLNLKDQYRDSVFNEEQLYKIQQITFNEQVRLQEMEAAKIQLQHRVKIYALLATILVLFVIGGLLWRNIRNKQKAFAILKRQNKEIDQQKGKIEEAYTELKSTQSQLLQREKMASLGELTAGIAHEIQNPLNFVNNFSEVNVGLLEELKTEMASPTPREAITIVDDLLANEQKILQHGRRADSIVKRMLQHSRVGSGRKDSTNINTLAEEFLRLSYHGIRAKDQNFTANLVTSFTEDLGEVTVNRQDVGRVFLNLFNNAFYSLQQKKKVQNDTFEPKIQVSTRRKAGRVEVSVKDNGVGIPEKLLSKIYQPFFTTKPTGEGTGLGLSLSYDIITEGHGGELKVNTKEGEGAEFIVQLPA
jgi:two-component system, NtrC family, sensor kinase